MMQLLRWLNIDLRLFSFFFQVNYIKNSEKNDKNNGDYNDDDDDYYYYSY